MPLVWAVLPAVSVACPWASLRHAHGHPFGMPMDMHSERRVDSGRQPTFEKPRLTHIGVSCAARHYK